MARKKIFKSEIKPIPMLFGEEGRRFIEKASQKATPEPPEVLERIKADYEMIKANNEIWMKKHQERWAKQEQMKRQEPSAVQ